MELVLSKDHLNSIDFSRYKKYDLDIGNEYFYLEAGKEHYRLLAHLSTLMNNRVFLDVGTNHGCSALALGYNPQNRIHTVDIVNNRKEKFKKEGNITFHLGDANEMLTGVRPSIAFLDADKSDDFEKSLIKNLIPIMAGSGYLIMDDYHEYPVVQECITDLIGKGFKVYDLTEYGHYSGTHLVDLYGDLRVKCI